MVTPLKPSSLRRRISAHLTDAILHSELRPGERIVEGKLARQLRVAQGTLREALQELEHQGLVHKHDHRGTYVCQLTAAEIEDIYIVRRVLEPLAGMMARERMTRDDHKQLAGMVEKMQRAGEAHNFPELLKIDLAFHRQIWNLSGSKSIERALNAVCPPLFAGYLIKSSSGEPYSPAKDLEEHYALLKALTTVGAQEVKKVFEEIMEAFRVDDVENLRALEAERENPPVERRARTPISE